MHRFLIVLLALALAGCPPTRNGRLDDDDDATSDDDDATADDDDAADDDDSMDDDDDDTPIEPPPPWDDDDIADDDDDDDDLCAEPGQTSLWFDASAGDIDGTWFEGDVAWNGSRLTVDGDSGPLLSVAVLGDNVDMDLMFSEVQGAGRVLVAATSWGAWTANGVLAIQSYWSYSTVVLGVNSPSVPAIGEIGYSLSVAPLDTACTTPLFDVDGCGLAAALPLGVELSTDWSAEYSEIWPDGFQWMGDGQFMHHTGWQLLGPSTCSDFDSVGYSWSYRTWGSVDG